MNAQHRLMRHVLALLAVSIATSIASSAIAAETKSTYRLISKVSGMALDVRGCGMTNGTKVQLWQPTGRACQQWRISQVGGGYFALKSELNGRMLDGGGSVPGAYVGMWDYWGGPTQHWRIESVGEGYYRLINQHGGRAMEVAGCSIPTGGDIQASTAPINDCQRWLIEADI